MDRAAADVDETPDTDRLGRRVERRKRIDDDVIRAEHRVDDMVAAGDGVAESVDVAGISEAAIRIVLKVTLIADHGPCIVARCAESAQDMAADEAAGSDHCNFHGRIVS